MAAISYHHTVKDVQGLPWEKPGPFACPEWFALLEQHGHSPLLALAREGDAAVCLPLVETGSGLAVLTNWYAFSWAGLQTPAAPPELLDLLARDLARRTHRIELSKLPREDGTLAALRHAFRQAGWLVLPEPCDTNHILPLDGRDYAAFLADRPGALRTTLKRKAARVEVALSTRFDPADWADYEAIYADSWKPGEGDPALLRAFAQQQSAGGHFRFAIARAGGEAVAAQFWTVENGTAYIHKLAHRTGARSLSPGTTLSAALFAHVIDVDHVTLVDFGTGDDPYKRDWMEAVRTRWRLTCLRPADPRNWPAIGKAMMRKLVSPAQHG